jgi:hypothetical protein
LTWLVLGRRLASTQARTMVRSQLRRIVIVVAALSAWTVMSAHGASAKLLPIESVRVTTQRPMVGAPIEVELRFIGGGNLGDYAWENMEVYVLPLARTGAGGWPLSVADAGVAVRLRLSAGNVYRGRFTVHEPGDYMVLDRSAVLARGDPAVNLRRPTAVPVHVLVLAPASARVVGPPTRDRAWLWGVLAGVAVVVAMIVAGAVRRRRARSQTPSEPHAPSLVDVP